MTRENDCDPWPHQHLGNCQRTGYRNGLADAREAAGQARILVVPSEEAMLHLLDGLNVSGLYPELPCIHLSGIGAWVACLTDPDASYVNYVYPDENGHSRCVVGCDNCGTEGVSDDFKPIYPVLTVVAAWPDLQRIADENYIDPWWAAEAP